MIRLFDVQNGKVIPTEHCYTLYFLKNIMKEYPEDYLKIYQYLFYMCCPNPDLNPFFHTLEAEKEELILQEIGAEFSTEDELIQHALEVCSKLYETETSRAYEGIKTALNNMATYMKNTAITDGRDGNISQIARVAKEFDMIRQSFKGVYKDLMEEQKSTVRGGQRLAYDS
jgi:hypothetical protein